MNYGFALEDNEEDNEAVLRVSCPLDVPALASKIRLAGSSKTVQAVREFQVPATYRETNDHEKKTMALFSFLRFVHATDTELIQIQTQYPVSIAQSAAAGNAPAGLPEIQLEAIGPISTRNEAAVLAHVGRAAREAQAAFATTLEEDDALLAANTFPDANVRNCVVQRRGEKQVLRWWQNLADEAIPLLSLKWADLRKHSSKYLSNSPKDFFMTNVVAILVKRGA